MRARSALISRAIAKAVCVFVAALWLACVASSAGLSAVSGTVRNAVTGLPVGHAVVRLVPVSADRPGYLATTGADGAFRFENVQPAEYQVIFERHGFTRDPELVRLLPDNETQLKLDTAPLGAIAGKVLDADGELVPNASVRVIGVDWVHGKRAYFEAGLADANERGEFRIPELQPGRYRVAAAPPLSFSISEGPGLPESRLAPAYYPSGLDLDSAAAVDLEAGQELGGIEFKLSMRPSFHVRGTAGAVWQSWLGLPVIQAIRLDNGRRADWFEFPSRIGADGAFDIAGVPPGVYALAGTQSFPAAPQIALVTVTSHDVNRVAIVKPAPATVRVALFYPPDTPDKANGLTFRLEQAAPSGWQAAFRQGSQTQHLPDGSLVFEKVIPGTYQPVLISGGHWYVKSMTYDGQPITTSGIEVANNSDAELGVTLAKANASVDVKISGSTGASVVAVALDTPLGNIRVQATNGASLNHLPPGRYLIFAVEKDGDWPWENEDFLNALRHHGAAVELTEGANADVELTALSQETLRRTEERIP